MELFVEVIFWMTLVSVVLRIFIMALNRQSDPVSMPVYAADTVLKACFAVWAGFVLWHR